MTNQGFSDGFDTLLSSYKMQGGFGEAVSKMDIVLDEYEKSLFLTQAQDNYVLSLYTGKNSAGESFEQTEELRRYLAPMIREAALAPITSTAGVLGMGSTSKFFTLPEDVWFITYESVAISSGPCGHATTLAVYPAKQDEYHKIKRNPFRGANDYRALRFDLSEGNVEIVSKYPVDTYYIRYLKTLSPIVLVDLPDGLEIRKQSASIPCELPEPLHQRILELAVALALRAKGFAVKTDNKE